MVLFKISAPVDMWEGEPPDLQRMCPDAGRPWPGVGPGGDVLLNTSYIHLAWQCTVKAHIQQGVTVQGVTVHTYNPALGRLRQEGHQYRICPDYIARSRLKITKMGKV